MPFATPFKRFKFNFEQQLQKDETFNILEIDSLKQLLLVREKGNVIDLEEAMEIKEFVQFMFEKIFVNFVEIIFKKDNPNNNNLMENWIDAFEKIWKMLTNFSNKNGNEFKLQFDWNWVLSIWKRLFEIEKDFGVDCLEPFFSSKSSDFSILRKLMVAISQKEITNKDLDSIDFQSHENVLLKNGLKMFFLHHLTAIEEQELLASKIFFSTIRKKFESYQTNQQQHQIPFIQHCFSELISLIQLTSISDTNDRFSEIFCKLFQSNKSTWNNCLLLLLKKLISIAKEESAQSNFRKLTSALNAMLAFALERMNEIIPLFSNSIMLLLSWQDKGVRENAVKVASNCCSSVPHMLAPLFSNRIKHETEYSIRISILFELAQLQIDHEHPNFGNFIEQSLFASSNFDPIAKVRLFALNLLNQNAKEKGLIADTLNKRFKDKDVSVRCRAFEIIEELILNGNKEETNIFSISSLRDFFVIGLSDKKDTIKYISQRIWREKCKNPFEQLDFLQEMKISDHMDVFEPILRKQTSELLLKMVENRNNNDDEEIKNQQQTQQQQQQQQQHEAEIEE